jgi:hypothetical protein
LPTAAKYPGSHLQVARNIILIDPAIPKIWYFIPNEKAPGKEISE